jgi:hypothetical protein
VVCTAAAMTVLATFVAAMGLSIAAPMLAKNLLQIPASLQGPMVAAIRVAALATVLRSIAGRLTPLKWSGCAGAGLRWQSPDPWFRKFHRD